MIKGNLDKFTLEDNVILKTITGSTSYGLNTKNSDQDEKAIVRLPPHLLFHLGEPWETQTFHEPDMEYHSVQKFMRLANKQNPTILEILNTKEEFILEQTEVGKILRNNKSLFLSSDCYKTFGGYARKQLLDIKNGLDKSNTSDLTDYLSIRIEELLESFEERFTYQSNQIEISNVVASDSGIDLCMNVHFDNIDIKQLNAMLSEIQNTHKGISKMNQRNRRADTHQLLKHAMHLIRLLIMGIEVLTTGKINVFRQKDREFLLSIREGKYSWEEIFEMAENLFIDLEKAYRSTILPKETDYEKINKLYYEIMTM